MPTGPSKSVVSPSGPYSTSSRLIVTSKFLLAGSWSKFHMPACTLMVHLLAPFPNGINSLHVPTLVNCKAADFSPGMRLEWQFLRPYHHISGHSATPQQTGGDRRALETQYSFWVEDTGVVHGLAYVLNNIRRSYSRGNFPVADESMHPCEVPIVAEPKQVENQKSGKGLASQESHDVISSLDGYS